MEIVSFNQEHLPGIREHFSRHWAESGKESAHFLPFDLAKTTRPRGIDPEASNKSFSELGWQRWLLVIDDGLVRGHASLKSDPMESGLHRCELGMGLEKNWRGKGMGRQLLTRVIDTAHAADELSWLDLRVMASNTNAIALYHSCGFNHVALIKDRFRIDGTSLDEVMMTLQLR